MAKLLMRLWWRLLALALYSVLVAGAFWVGFELGQERVKVVVEPERSALEQAHRIALAEVVSFKEAVTALKQEGSVLERSRQIEKETNRSLQEQLKQAQDERLALVKEASYLKRLVQEGGKGAVRVHDLRLTPGEVPRVFRYSFTVTQLIRGFGESRGAVEVSLKGDENGEEAVWPLEKLPDANPERLSMQFDHFQTISGEFALPEGFEPRLMTVTIDPQGDLLEETAEAFPWIVDSPWAAADESGDSVEPARP